MVERIQPGTPDGTEENVERIAGLFPEVVTEVEDAEGNLERVVDFDALRDLLGDVAEGQRERYQFTWPGKAAAKAEARKPIRKTMRPEPEKSVDWDTTRNIYIEGDNLDALKLLKETYAGQVKLIYIDPPYNTGHDFLYDDDYSQSTEEFEAQSGDFDDDNRRLTTNSSTYGRFHSRWCSNFLSRIIAARSMLSKDGVLLVSIGDGELGNVQNILDEVFGPSSRLCVFVWKSRAKPTNAGNAKYRPQKVAEYVFAYLNGDPDETVFNVIPAKEHSYPHQDDKGLYRTTTILTSNRGTFRRETMRFESHGFTPPEDYRWKAGKNTIDRLFNTGHMTFNDDGMPMEKKYKAEESDPLYPIYCYMDSDISGTAELGKNELNALIGNQHGFDTVKPVPLIKYFVQTFTNAGDLVVDFYSGSATTAQAVMEQNAEDQGARRFALVQFPEPIDIGGAEYQVGYRTICDIGEERIRRAGAKIRAEVEEANRQLKLGEEPKPVPDVGFRVLRIDSSNMEDTYRTPDETDQMDLLSLADNVKLDRTPEDLLFEVLPKFRIPYSARIEKRSLGGRECFLVDGNRLVACFDTEVGTETIEEMAKLEPDYAVMRDASMRDDATQANFEELFKTYSADTVRRVI